jgi:hypothetical protein
MAQPKKQKSARKTGFGRNHILEKLAKRVNGMSPVKVALTKRLGKKKAATKKPADKRPATKSK